VWAAVVCALVIGLSAWVRVLYRYAERLRARVGQAEELLYKAEYHLRRVEELRFFLWRVHTGCVQDNIHPTGWAGAWAKETKPFEPDEQVIHLQREIRWFCPSRIIGTERLPSPHADDWLNVEHWQDRPRDIV